MQNALNAEYAVVGYILTDPAAVVQLAALIQPGWLQHPSLRKIFESAAANENISPAAAADLLLEDLEQREALQVVTRAQELAARSLKAAQDNAARIVAAAQLRGLKAEIAAALNEGIDDPQRLAEVIAGIGQRNLKHSIGGYSSIANELTRWLQALDDPAPELLDVGYTRLDNLLCGLRPGQLVVIGARPGAGKTAFALEIARRVAAEGKPVLIHSLEMSYAELLERLIVNAGDVTLSELDRRQPLNQKQRQKIDEAARYLYSLPIKIDDRKRLTIDQIRAGARMYPETRLLIVDYLQLVARPSMTTKSIYEQVTMLTRELKVLAMELGIPVIILSQLNRGTGQYDRPELRSLRDSGSIEQDADKVLLLWETKEHLRAIDVAKNRRGRTGIVQYEWYGGHQRFVETAWAYDEENEKKSPGRPTYSAPA